VVLRNLRLVGASSSGEEKAQHASIFQLKIYFTPYFQSTSITMRKIRVYNEVVEPVFLTAMSATRGKREQNRSEIIHASVPSSNMLGQADLRILGCADLGHCCMCSSHGEVRLTAEARQMNPTALRNFNDFS